MFGNLMEKTFTKRVGFYMHQRPPEDEASMESQVEERKKKHPP